MRVNETVGSIDVEAQEDGLYIMQPDITGNGDHASIFVPWNLVSALSRAIREVQKEHRAEK